mmetsp:Transcript_16963/g.34003  ORF Transcript_16963/g.34003 Transcript_16963/m.34003 type:complete len:233 (-) Transcript_16963:787-1485(-)
MRFSSTYASPGERAHWIINRPMMSCATMTSAISGATMLTSSRLSTSCISTTTCAVSPSMPFSDSPCRTIRESASSGSFMLSGDSAMIARAVITDTLCSSCSSSGLPLRKMTSVPLRSRPLSRLSTAARNVISISAFSCSASTTIEPPPSLSFANASCWMMASDLSFHPSINVWLLSITRDLPFFSSSTFSPMNSEMMPIMSANTNIPPMVMMNDPSRTAVPFASACTPGSAT